MDETASEIIVSAQQLVSTKTFFCASVFLLAYDHILTFSDEVELAWKRKITPVTCLFLLNRYYALAVNTVLLVAEFSPLWNTQVFVITVMERPLISLTCTSCKHFVLFEPLGVGIVLLTITQLILTLRVAALYGQNKVVIGYLAGLLCAQLVIGLWTLSLPGSGPLPLPNSGILTGCFYLSGSNTTKISTGCLWIEITFDLSVFGLTLARTLRAVADDSALGLVRTVFRDGILYFLVIFSTNLVWALMVLFAPVGLKYINAEPSVILVVIMINRLTLNLRSRLVPSSAITSSYAQNSAPFWTFTRHQHRGVLSESESQSRSTTAISEGSIHVETEAEQEAGVCSEVIELDTVPPTSRTPSPIQEAGCSFVAGTAGEHPLDNVGFP